MNGLLRCLMFFFCCLLLVNFVVAGFCRSWISHRDTHKVRRSTRLFSSVQQENTIATHILTQRGQSSSRKKKKNDKRVQLRAPTPLPKPAIATPALTSGTRDSRTDTLLTNPTTSQMTYGLPARPRRRRLNGIHDTSTRTRTARICR